MGGEEDRRSMGLYLTGIGEEQLGGARHGRRRSVRDQNWRSQSQIGSSIPEWKGNIYMNESENENGMEGIIKRRKRGR